MKSKLSTLFILLVFFVGTSCTTWNPHRCPATSLNSKSACVKTMEVGNFETVKLGLIGSVILFSNTRLEHNWNQIYSIAIRKYPNLNLTLPRDLHLTLIYVGNWKMQHLSKIVNMSTIKPHTNMDLIPSLKRFGGKLLVLSFSNADKDWVNKVDSARLKLNELNIRDAGSLDFQFEPHISLASPKEKNPSQEQLTELKNFEDWLVSTGFLNQRITIGPQSDLKVIVTESSKPADVTSTPIF